MQARMKKYPLSEARIHDLLQSEEVGRLATLGEDGYPYITPIHFVFVQDKIYIHGLAAGEKLRNIAANPHVGFEVEKMISFIHDAEKPCGTNTEYESVIIRGLASMLEDADKKIAILDAFVKKYTPQHAGKAFPPSALQKTGIIEVEVRFCSGKYYSDKDKDAS